MDSSPQKINLISCEPMVHVSDIKLIRTDTTLDLSQKAEKVTIKLEFIKAIVTAEEMQFSSEGSYCLHMLNNSSNRFHIFHEPADEQKSEMQVFTGREWLHVPEAAECLPSELSFEFLAYLEISLEAVYNYLDSIYGCLFSKLCFPVWLKGSQIQGRYAGSTTCSAREKARVINLEFITAEELLLFDRLCQEVLTFVEQLKQQIPLKDQPKLHGPADEPSSGMQISTVREWLHVPEAAVGFSFHLSFLHT
ncbi:hypothetical protein VNO77_01050 [Canavalia gladiata]|uniref:Uncharacterized protein n=1 Tax=Canavalia gladiata TaxID=3824 RepID=A0AAN9R5X1_CANGL